VARGLHQPQQSVLYPQAGQRQTACIRNISWPHRSQGIPPGSVGPFCGAHVRIGTARVTFTGSGMRHYH
jgi:hypothetical protein